ncbi:MAG: ribonuclease H-like domain-containing protein [Polyangiaceae bacterium]
MASFRSKLARLTPKAAGPARAIPAEEPEPELSALRQALAHALGRPAASSRVGSGEAPPLEQDDLALTVVEPGDGAGGRLHRRRRVLPPGQRFGSVCLHDAPLGDRRMLSLLALTPALASADLERVLFLDTETSGLGSGTANVAFLVGLAYHEDGQLVLEQLFLRERDEEEAMLREVARRIEACEVIASYNGKSFDLPVLRGRFVMAGLRPPPERTHLDLLHLARRVHRQRAWGKSLPNLEREVLGFRRGPDIAGEEVAARYRHYLRTGVTAGLRAVIDHNEWDVLSLVALVALYGEPLERLSASDIASAARVVRRAGDLEEAASLAQRAVTQGAGSHGLRVRAEVAKARGDKQQALADFEALAATVGDPSARLELAKLYEHHLREPGRALAMVELGVDEDGAAVARRRARLTRKLARTRAQEHARGGAGAGAAQPPPRAGAPSAIRTSAVGTLDPHGRGEAGKAAG